jgi:hypothetical protein
MIATAGIRGVKNPGIEVRLSFAALVVLAYLIASRHRNLALTWFGLSEQVRGLDKCISAPVKLRSGPQVGPPAA